MIITGTSIVSRLVRYTFDQLTRSPEKQSQQQQTCSHLRHSTSDCRAADSLAFLVSLPPQRKTQGSCLQHSIKKTLSHSGIPGPLPAVPDLQNRTIPLHLMLLLLPEATTYMQESLDVCCCWVWSKSAVPSKSLFLLLPAYPTPPPLDITVQLHVRTGSSNDTMSPRTVQQVPEPWHIPWRPQQLLMQLPSQYAEESHETSTDPGRAGFKLFLHKKKEW